MAEAEEVSGVDMLTAIANHRAALGAAVPIVAPEEEDELAADDAEASDVQS